MATEVKGAARALLEGKNVAFLATLAEDGSPQVTPVWVDFDGEHVLVNSEEKRAKVQHVKRDPRVALTVAEAGNAYKYVELRGRVVETTTDGAMELIDKLARKYIGQDKYPWNQPGDVRVILKIAVDKVLGNSS